MKVSSIVLPSVQAAAVMSTPAMEKMVLAPLRNGISSTSGTNKLYPKQSPAEKRACNYNGCDDCLACSPTCRSCQGPGDHPRACLSWYVGTFLRMSVLE